uniref:Uncharacterized protein n=1 Tax=Cacopsylla melanoneura TaxID=428564 RepID=A0A8D9B2H4_9HEMI
MHLACVSSVSVIQVCSILISVVLCDYDYDNVKDSYEVPIFETCGTLLQDYWNASKLRTLNPEEREMFYDSYVLNKIEREDNRTLDLMKDEPTLDYSAINDTHEQTLFKTCGTLLQHYWENYDLRNLTSSERNFYYDESMMRKIEKEEKEVLQEHKDQEWLKKMEEKILNERIDSEERRRTTDKEYDDWVSPVPKTTVLRMSPMDNLFISQASNVSDTDISDSTFNREMKYGDAPKWLTDRFDQLQEEAIRKRDKKAIHDAVMYGFLPSTGFIVQSTATTRKRRMLTHRYERTEKTSNKVHRKTHHPHEPNGRKNSSWSSPVTASLCLLTVFL